MAESAPYSAQSVDYKNSRTCWRMFSNNRDETRTVNFPHPKGACSICCDESGLRMQCGHFICPDDLLDCTWQQLSNIKYEISCPQCTSIISQDDIMKFGLPTLEEKKILMTAIATNYCESQDIQECPKCRTLCQRTKEEKAKVHCTVCPKENGNWFMFCWYCLREWQNVSSCQVCGNANCKKEIIDKLLNSPQKEFTDSNGKKLNIPSMRACPRCHTLLEHKDGCNLFTCSSCRQQFCFICLSKMIGGNLICNSVSYNSTGIKCSPAPIQTKLK